MQDVRFKRNEFSLQEFIDSILKFVETQVPEGNLEQWIKRVEGTRIVDEPGAQRDLARELDKDGLQLFFMFSGTNVGDPIPCADGKKYELDDDWDDEEVEQDEEKDDEDTFTLGMVGCVGYLVRVVDDTVTIKPGVWDSEGPIPPRFYEEDDYGVFEEPLKEFIKRFVKR